MRLQISHMGTLWPADCLGHSRRRVMDGRLFCDLA